MPIASIQPMPGEAETCWTQEVQQTLQILDAVLGLGSYRRPSWKPNTSTEALAQEREGFIEVVVLAKFTGPNDCRLRWDGTASQVMCNLILIIRIHRSRCTKEVKSRKHVSTCLPFFTRAERNMHDRSHLNGRKLGFFT